MATHTLTLKRVAHSFAAAFMAAIAILACVTDAHAMPRNARKCAKGLAPGSGSLTLFFSAPDDVQKFVLDPIVASGRLDELIITDFEQYFDRRQASIADTYGNLGTEAQSAVIRRIAGQLIQMTQGKVAFLGLDEAQLAQFKKLWTDFTNKDPAQLENWIEIQIQARTSKSEEYKPNGVMIPLFPRPGASQDFETFCQNARSQLLNYYLSFAFDEVSRMGLFAVNATGAMREYKTRAIETYLKLGTIIRSPTDESATRQTNLSPRDQDYISSVRRSNLSGEQGPPMLWYSLATDEPQILRSQVIAALEATVRKVNFRQITDTRRFALILDPIVYFVRRLPDDESEAGTIRKQLMSRIFQAVGVAKNKGMRPSDLGNSCPDTYYSAWPSRFGAP